MSFGGSKREDVLKQSNVLDAALPQDHSGYSGEGDPKVDMLFPSSGSVFFGHSQRDDVLKQSNPLGCAMPQDYSQLNDSVEKYHSDIDSRYRSAISADFGVAARGDVALQHNALGVYLPQDHSHYQDMGSNVNGISSIDSRYHRPPAHGFGTSKRPEVGVHRASDHVAMMTGEQLMSPMNSKFRRAGAASLTNTHRDDVFKRHNDLNASLPKDLSMEVDTGRMMDKPSVVDSRYKREPNAHFGHSRRDDVLLRHNELGAALPQDHSNYQSVTTGDIDKIYPSPPTFKFSNAPREAILGHANKQGRSVPKDLSAQGPLNLAPSPKSSSKYRRSAAASMSLSKREDAAKLNNGIGASTIRDMSSNGAQSSQDICFADSKRRRPTTVHFGRSTRGDTLKLHNELGVPLPQDHSNVTDSISLDKIISPVDSRYKKPPSVFIPQSSREDAFKLANVLGGSRPYANSDAPMMGQVSAFESPSAVKNRKGPEHTFGASSRKDIERTAQAMTMGVTPNVSSTAKVPYYNPKLSATSKVRRSASTSFGVGSRDDINMLSNPQGGARMPARAKTKRAGQQARFKKNSPEREKFLEGLRKKAAARAAKKKAEAGKKKKYQSRGWSEKDWRKHFVLNKPTRNQTDPHMTTKLRRSAQVVRTTKTDVHYLAQRTAKIKAEMEKAHKALNS